MGRVVIRNVNESPTAIPPTSAGISVVGDVETKGVITEVSRPIMLWQHTMAPHGEIHWRQPPMGHVAYVWDGVADVNGTPVCRDGVVIIEHGAEAVLRTTTSSATVLHFHRPANLSAETSRAGGHVHVVNGNNAPQYRSSASTGYLFATSSCPTCELWFHKNVFPSGSPGAGLHSHSEDEIIFVLDGTMTLGRRKLSRGTALAIDATTVYRFGVGDDGLTFINFRPTHSYLSKVTPEGVASPISEQQLMTDAVVRTATEGIARH